jgi:hypothetical protein
VAKGKVLIYLVNSKIVAYKGTIRKFLNIVAVHLVDPIQSPICFFGIFFSCQCPINSLNFPFTQKLVSNFLSLSELSLVFFFIYLNIVTMLCVVLSSVPIEVTPTAPPPIASFYINIFYTTIKIVMLMSEKHHVNQHCNMKIPKFLSGVYWLNLCTEYYRY